MKNRILSALLALCLLCTMMPTVAFATDIESDTPVQILASNVVTAEDAEQPTVEMDDSTSDATEPAACTYESVVTEPTCAEGGYTTHTCTSCGDSYTDSETAALGHDYVDGTCTRCGEEEVVLTSPTVKASIIKASGKIKLSWDAVEGAKGYKVYYSTDGGDTYTLLKKVSGTSLNHTSAKAGNTYHYYVVALNAEGTESEMDEDKVVFIKCKLAQPSITVSNIASSGKIRIQWEKISGASKYEVYVSTDGGDTYSLLGSSSSTKLNHSSAEAGVKYRYKVMATGKNSDGNRAYSEYSSAKNRTCDLAQPKIKLSANSAGKNKIAWKHIDGAVKYEVYRSTDGGDNYSKLTTTYNNSVVNTSSEVGKTYYYKVKAIAENTDANSAFSSAKSRKVEKAGPEVSVTLTSAGKPKLSWDKVSGASKYKVLVSTDGGYSFTTLKTTTSTSLTHSSAEAGTTYQYVVKAVMDGGNRTSAIAIGPCTRANINNAKSAKSVVNRINEYREAYGIPTLKWYASGLNAAKVRAAEINYDYTRDEEQLEELMEAYDCYLELALGFEGTADELVDLIMENYYDYASYFMYEGFTYAAVAKSGDWWVLYFG